MKRRNFIQLSSILSFVGLAPVITNASVVDDNVLDGELDANGLKDRMYWVQLLDKMASPILSNMSKGELRKNMPMDYSPTWDNRNKEVAYMEAIGRLIVGIAPFVALPDDDTKEGRIRKKMRDQIHASLAHAVDPASPDYLYWGSPKVAQPLVDAAFLAQALLLAPAALWEPLDKQTKERFIFEFTKIRAIKPANNNWVLFAAIIETFLLSIDAPYDAARIDAGIDKIQGWYVGDGWYSDGVKFHFDHYNGFVIQPMLVTVLRVNVSKGRRTQAELDLAIKRMKRYASFQERFISPEGTFPVFGRSSTYRVGAFWPLATLALENNLPAGVLHSQVRPALTAVFKRVFVKDTFNGSGLLTLGFVGANQSNIADSYSNTGSMYLASFAFMPLGLPASHDFWTAAPTNWTQKKAWNGEVFPKDYAVDY
jgi:hypothetical protein